MIKLFKRKEFKAMRFNQIKNLPPDDRGLSHSIVRVYNGFIDAKKQNQKLLFRRQPVVITNLEDPGNWILRYVMGSSGTVGINKNTLALDYDGTDALGINYNQELSLELRKATTMEIYTWFWTHPDLSISLSVRLGVVGALLGIISLFITFISFA